MIRRFCFAFFLAGLLPLLCRAQNSQAPAASPPSAQPASSSAGVKKPKKVWTDDDVKSLKSDVSVVGDKARMKTNSAVEEKDEEEEDSHAAAVSRYREEITQLKTQIGLADARISQLQNFKADNATPSGGINLHKRYTMLPPEEQIKKLEAAKKQLQAKIDDLELQAEKEGIDPGELR